MRARCGVDLLRVLGGGPAYLATFLPALRTVFETLFCYPKPVVAAINGYARKAVMRG